MTTPPTEKSFEEKIEEGSWEIWHSHSLPCREAFGHGASLARPLAQREGFLMAVKLLRSDEGNEFGQREYSIESNRNYADWLESKMDEVLK